MDAPLALYRRYRPDTFSEVIGQDHVTVPLRNALSNNRVNHAYLFSGPRGCGKTTSARILARAINCEKGPIAEPCGVCQSCQDLARGGPGSIDVIEIDAASHGGVDDARDLRERAFFSPVQSRYKIYIIDEAHMVTTQGFNALLKLVEEPPPHLKFIFATTEPDKVIGTIRSRTHHYPFRLVPPKVLAEYMAHLCGAEGVTIAPAALPLVVRAGAGSVRDSLSVLDQLIGGADADGVTYRLAVALLGFTPDSLLDACVDGFAAHDSAAVFEVIDKVIETGQDPKRFAEDLLRRLRDLVVLSAVPSAVASGLIEVAEDQGERLQTQAAGIGPAELTRAADIVAAGLLEMRGATAPRLQLELICAKVLLPGADDSTNGIQARLDRIERRLTIGVPAVPVTTGTPVGPAAPAVAAPADGAAESVPGEPAAERSAAWPDETGMPGRSGGAATTDRATPPWSGQLDPGDRGSSATSPASSPSERTEQGGPAGVATAGNAAASDPSDAPQTPSRPAPAQQATAQQPTAQQATAQQPTAQPAPAQAAAAQPAAAPVSSGSVGLADVRRLWPEILDAVKSKRRFAWIMLSQNAQVIAIDEQTLTLGLVNAGARESFARSGSDEILRQAMVDTIGLNRRVEAVVDPSTDPGATASATPAASAPPQPSPTAWDRTPPVAPAGSAAVGFPAAGSPADASPAAGSPAGGPPVDDRASNTEPPVGDVTVASSRTGASETDSSGTDSPVTHGAGSHGAGSRGAGSHGAETESVGTGGVGASSTRPGSAGPGHAEPGDLELGRAEADTAWINGAATDGRSRSRPAGSEGSASPDLPRLSEPSRQQSSGGQHAVARETQGSGDQWSGQAADGLRAGAASVGGQVVGAPVALGAADRGQPTGLAAGQQAGGPPAPAGNPEQRRDQVASKRRAAEATVAAERARRAGQAPPPETPMTPEEEAEAVGDDDLILEDDSRSHTELLRQTLGAQIITEETN